jgi:diaminohydroxyphosphoribosylaminopyrimidine deaminase/5-amino-6-(5-phosphoribosylamino)uracil reductase
MERAIELASRGGRKVRPNPMVGAIVVKDDRIIGEGYHEAYGGPHAETNALNGTSAEGATMYCTLEPCCFTDRTKHQPPCVEAIIRAGIRHVIVAQIDPNPKVAGRGIAQLRDAGIGAQVGVLAREAAILNRGYNTEMAIGRPFIHLKWAESLDGCIATRTGDSKWITDGTARRRAQQLRSESDAVLVGIGTVLRDDPLLTVRSTPVIVQPRAVVLDTHLGIRRAHRLVAERGGDLIVVTAAPTDCDAAKRLEQDGVTLVSVPVGPTGFVHLEDAIHRLSAIGVRRLFVEGGASVLGSFLTSGLYDRVTVFTAPVILGDGLSPSSPPSLTAPARSRGSVVAQHITDAPRLTNVTIERIGDQTLTDGYRADWIETFAPCRPDGEAGRTVRERTTIRGLGRHPCSPV